MAKLFNKFPEAFNKRASKIADALGEVAVDAVKKTGNVAGDVARKSGESFVKKLDDIGVDGGKAIIISKIDKTYKRVSYRNVSDVNEENFKLSPDCISDSAVNSYKRQLSLYEKRINDFTIDSIYHNWARKLNNHILFYLFGNIFTVRKRITETSNEQSCSIDQEKKINLLINIYYASISLKKYYEYIQMYLPYYLNSYDEKWKTGVLKQMSNGSDVSFHYLDFSINYVCNTLLRRISEIERILARLDSIIARQGLSFIDHIKDIGPSLLSPLTYILKADDIVNRISPSLINDKEKDRILKSYDKCREKFDDIYNQVIPLLINTVNENTYILFSRIIDRDFSIIAKHNIPTRNVKEAQFKRFLQLSEIQKVQFDLYRSHEIKDSNGTCVKSTYEKVIQEIYSQAKAMDFSPLVPIEMEDE